jgi:hypothetical protein
MKTSQYMTPNDILNSRDTCMTLRSKESVSESPLWFKEVMRRMVLKKQHIENTSSGKVAMIKKCPDCDKQKSFPEQLIDSRKNPVIIRCTECQKIFDDAEYKKRTAEHKKSEEMKIQVEASERERKFFQKLPPSIIESIKPIDISEFKEYGYWSKLPLNDIDRIGYSILLSFFLSGKDKVELISHTDLMNKIRSADKDIDGIIEFYKSRDLMVITDFNGNLGTDYIKMQIKNIILNRSFIKAKTFVLIEKCNEMRGTTEMNFFEEIKEGVLK